MICMFLIIFLLKKCARNACFSQALPVLKKYSLTIPLDPGEIGNRDDSEQQLARVARVTERVTFFSRLIR